jgi:uncharacterized protein (DUF427 family)
LGRENFSIQGISPDRRAHGEADHKQENALHRYQHRDGDLVVNSFRKMAFLVASLGQVKATWNEATLAQSDDTVVVEGNHYFPADSIDRRYFSASETHSICPWKGEASYYDIVVNGQTNKDAAWFYPEPKEAAANIKDRVAFWKGVVVE